MTSDQLLRLMSGAAEVVPKGGLQDKLALGRPLRVKLGLDPTAAEVTLGWAVVLRKLRQFQDEGHVAVLIVGDFTARVGDPSGRSDTRPRLRKGVVRRYADRLLEQFWTILDRERTEVRYNSDWLEGMDMEAILGLTASCTVAQMLERDDFAKRYAEGRPISIMEFLYPLLQGMDSVATKADVELGGTDQKFNLLVGRELQRDHGQDPQVAFTMPLLVGTDGVQKMSQSLGNYIGIAEAPDDMYGKLVGLSDELIPEYRRLVLDFFADPNEAERVAAGLADGTRDPWLEKRRMACEAVSLYHGSGAGEEAEARFDLVHKERGILSEVEVRVIPTEALRAGRVWLPRLLVKLGVADSNSAARRLILQGAVRLDGEQVMDQDADYEPADIDGRVLQVGRREHALGVRLQAQGDTE
ncbi:MAG: tyrosine--tRNA ligase [Actinomycetota bacterium]